MTFDELKQEATKAENLDELFDIWKEAHSQEPLEHWDKTKKRFDDSIPKDNFVYDGIIESEVFKNENLKILFISNEANVKSYEYKSGDRREDFKAYYEKKEDRFKGKMCERICAIFNEIIREPSPEYYKSAKRFAFMNINKRGGSNQIGDGSHIKEYCDLYKEFIEREISLNDPDLIVWLGIKTYNMNLLQNIGADCKGNILYINVNGHDVPIMKMWHTCYYRASKNSLSNYNEVEKEYMSIGIGNRLIIKLAAKARLEYDLLNK